MSRTLITALWTGAALMATAIAAPAAAELGRATADPHGRMADWLDFRIDDEVFAQSAHGTFVLQPTANPTVGIIAFLGGAEPIDGVSFRPYSSLTHSGTYGDSFDGPAVSFVGRGSLIGAIGLQTSSQFDTGMGALETLIDLYLAHELDIDGVRFKTLPGALSRNIYAESVDPAKFDFENALSFRIKGMLAGYFHYETRVHVRSTGIREVSGAIRFRW